MSRCYPPAFAVKHHQASQHERAHFHVRNEAPGNVCLPTGRPNCSCQDTSNVLMSIAAHSRSHDPACASWPGHVHFLRHSHPWTGEDQSFPHAVAFQSPSVAPLRTSLRAPRWISPKEVLKDAVRAACHAHSVKCALLYSQTNSIRRKQVLETRTLYFYLVPFSVFA